jgi:hypothetical protein
MGVTTREADEWASGCSKSSRRNYVNNFNRNQPAHERAIWGPMSHGNSSSKPSQVEVAQRLRERLCRYKGVYEIVIETQVWGLEYQIFEKETNKFIGGYPTQEIAMKIANERFDKRKI